MDLAAPATDDDDDDDDDDIGFGFWVPKANPVMANNTNFLALLEAANKELKSWTRSPLVEVLCV